MAVETPKGLEQIKEVHMLVSRVLGSQRSRAEHREKSGWETEIWRACQRSSIAVKRARRTLLSGDVRARPVYIVDGTSEIRIVLRLRAATGVKMSSGEHSAAVQAQLTDDETRMRRLIGMTLAAGRS